MRRFRQQTVRKRKISTQNGLYELVDLVYINPEESTIFIIVGHISEEIGQEK